MLKWIGYTKGMEGLPGIPARDLTDEEVAQHGGEKTLLATGLYEKPEGKRSPARPIADLPPAGVEEDED